MNAITTEEPMAKIKGRPKKPGGEGTPVRLDTDLVTKARYIVANRGIALSEYLSGLLRSAIERDFRKEGKEIMGEDK